MMMMMTTTMMCDTRDALVALARSVEKTVRVVREIWKHGYVHFSFWSHLERRKKKDDD